jgi:undecaprenyl-phosphate 4-deoxy-4-formamido-L-arabinose transferase
MFFNFSIMPLRVANLIGAVLCVFGLILLVWVLVEKLFLGVSQSGWTSIMAAISIFSGTQLVILGVIGEYVGRTYMTLSGKPQSLVREVVEHSVSTPLIAEATSA